MWKWDYSQHWLCTCQLDSVTPWLAQVRAYSSMAWHTHSSPVLQWQASDSHTDTNAAASTKWAQRRKSAELLMASHRDIWSWNTHIHTLKNRKKCNLYDKADSMDCNKVVVFVVQVSVWLSLILRCCCSSAMGARCVYRVHLLLSWPRNLQSHMDHLSENLNTHIYKSMNFMKPVKNMFWSYFISKCTLNNYKKVWSL